jgi:hypothetical protein
MIIDEQDLFAYVFFPENLETDKKQAIESDEALKESIVFYKQLKLNSESGPSSDIKKKLAEKISAYKLADIVELYPLRDLVPQNKNGIRLAASTKELTSKTTTKTFVDSDKEYLIKVMNYGTETKVFVFSTKNEIVRNFDLIIEPQKLTYHLEDNSEPLIVPHHVNAEKIQLKLSS